VGSKPRRQASWQTARISGPVSALASIVPHGPARRPRRHAIRIASDHEQILPLAIRDPRRHRRRRAGVVAPTAGACGGRTGRAAEDRRFNLPIEAPQPEERLKIAAKPKPKAELACTDAGSGNPPTPEVASAPATAKATRAMGGGR
jgi:hypothetical protein